MNPPRLTIAVPAAWLAAHRALLTLLETLWPVEFSDAPVRAVAARICHEAPGPHDDCPHVLVVPAPLAGTPGAAGQPGAAQVRFADDPAVPWPYRARTIATRLALVATSAPGAGERVLAHDAAGRVLWSVDDAHGRYLGRSHLPLCLLQCPPGADTAGAPLAQLAGAECFVQLLPLFELARVTCGAARPVRLPYHARPPLCASFIVDDPNLHRPTYGYVDYQAIALHAARERYHVGVATIPLDAWYAHPTAVAVFGRHREQLSLLIHGNDHARNELAQGYTPLRSRQLLHQAITRIEALERRTGLQVGRVMVPPHGACSAAMLAQLPAHGFDAVCVSVGSLLACNPGQPWTRNIGFAPIERIEGCAVLQRWSLTAVTHDVLLAAAYLGQALILRAHHQDLRHGLDVFGDAARFINSLGEVQWADLGTLARPGNPGTDPATARAAGDAAVPQPGASPTAPAPAAAGLAGVWRQAWPVPELVPEHHPTQARLILRRLLTEARDRLRLG
ncbi:MAG: hypothetical protein RLZZ584_2198 [Pseudomonadota bacterium]